MRRRVIRHRLPVMATLGARAHRQPFIELLVDDVLPIRRRAFLRIDLVEDVLEHRLLVAEELALRVAERVGDISHCFVTGAVL